MGVVEGKVKLFYYCMATVDTDVLVYLLQEQ